MKKIVKPNKLVLDKMIISKLDEKFLVKVLGGSKRLRFERRKY
ncbi:class I lanthipeptide [Aquimarina algiphila]